MKILWSVIILAAPIAIYFFVIRPRLQAKFTETYAEIDGFWARLWARIVAFRTLVVGSIGVFLSEAPALLDSLNTLDLSFLPPHWQSTLRVLTIVAIMYMRAVSTTPDGQRQ